MIRKTFICMGVAAALTVCAGFAFAQDNTEAPECIKGTVLNVTENTLYLQNTPLPGDTPVKQTPTVLLDRTTQYFDGTKKVTRESLQPGYIVLIHCKMQGKDRKASLIRIIGGKKL